MEDCLNRILEKKSERIFRLMALKILEKLGKWLSGRTSEEMPVGFSEGIHEEIHGTFSKEVVRVISGGQIHKGIPEEIL